MWYLRNCCGTCNVYILITLDNNNVDLPDFEPFFSLYTLPRHIPQLARLVVFFIYFFSVWTILTHMTTMLRFKHMWKPPLFRLIVWAWKRWNFRLHIFGHHQSHEDAPFGVAFGKSKGPISLIKTIIMIIPCRKACTDVPISNVQPIRSSLL